MTGDLSCRELVDLVTSYLDGALTEDDRVRFEQHLVICGGCAAYMDQIRATRRGLGTLREETIDPAARDRLLAAFRDWKRR